VRHGWNTAAISVAGSQMGEVIMRPAPSAKDRANASLRVHPVAVWRRPAPFVIPACAGMTATSF
jgi:hypothetical protein